MEVLWSAHRHGVATESIDHVLRHAGVVEQISEDPSRYLVLGPDEAGNLLELVVLDRPQGPAVIHAIGDERQVSPPAAEGMVRMSSTHGTTNEGTPITDEMVEAMADEAEGGYDVEEILRRRRGGRPPMGLGGLLSGVGAAGPRVQT